MADLITRLIPLLAQANPGDLSRTAREVREELEHVLDNGSSDPELAELLEVLEQASGRAGQRVERRELSPWALTLVMELASAASQDGLANALSGALAQVEMLQRHAPKHPGAACDLVEAQQIKGALELVLSQRVAQEVAGG